MILKNINKKLPKETLLTAVMWFSIFFIFAEYRNLQAAINTQNTGTEYISDTNEQSYRNYYNTGKNTEIREAKKITLLK